MIALEMEISGIKDLFERMDEFSAINILRNPMEETVLLLQSYMANYPPIKSSKSVYTRTGTLGRTWTKAVNNISDGVEGKVGNRTGYAPFVQSAMFQARWHKDWWQTDQKALDVNLSQIEKIFRNAIESV